MNFYIIGYTMEEYVINGITIPRKIYTDIEKLKGKKEVVVVTEEQVTALRNNGIFKSLEERKKIRVMDKEPSWAMSGEAREAGYKQQIAALEKKVADNTKAKELAKQVKELEAQVATLTAEKAAIIKEAEETIASLQKGK